MIAHLTETQIWYLFIWAFAFIWATVTSLRLLRLESQIIANLQIKKTYAYFKVVKNEYQTNRYPEIDQLNFI